MADTTYAYLNLKVVEINERMLSNARRKDSAYTQVDAAVVDLSAMGAAYSGVSADINAQAAANPDDAAWQQLKAEKDLLISEFQTQDTDMEALQLAMEPWRPEA